MRERIFWKAIKHTEYPPMHHKSMYLTTINDHQEQSIHCKEREQAQLFFSCKKCAGLSPVDLVSKHRSSVFGTVASQWPCQENVKECDIISTYHQQQLANAWLHFCCRDGSHFRSSQASNGNGKDTKDHESPFNPSPFSFVEKPVLLDRRMSAWGTGP